MPEQPANELDLQRRWAESRWSAPFLQSPDDESIRVIFPGVWNRGAGPDFRGAQILDGEGRARRGDVELHLEAGAWLQHGHADDPAYDDLLLHVVAWADRPRPGGPPPDARIPAATPLPPPGPSRSGPVARPPCADVVQHAGSAAVEVRLLEIARRRFLRKVRELRALDAPSGPGSSDDRRAVIAAARALGQPRNALLAERAARRALERADAWDQLAPALDADAWDQLAPALDADAWRPGRGALGTPAGWSLVLTTLVCRWTASASTPWSAVQRLARLPRREAIEELRIARCLGPPRAAQLLADAVYPLTASWRPWSQLPGARYQRTDALRERIDGESGAEFGWRHPQTQALLELEQTRCRQWACRICPVAALARPRRHAYDPAEKTAGPEVEKTSMSSAASRRR